MFSIEGLRVFGMGPGDKVTMRGLLRMIPTENREGFMLVLHDVFRHSSVLATDLPVVLPDGRQQRIIHVEAEPEFNEHGNLSGYTGIVQDVTDRRIAEDKIRHLANFDALTGLPNRRQFEAVLGGQVDRVARSGEPALLLMLDIDHFKQVNDRFGHQVGDEVLRYFSKRAAAEMRDTDRLGRYGGEEFLAVLTATEDASSAHLAAERVRDGVAKHDWGRVAPDLQVTVSLGVAVCQPDESIEQLLARADAALYAAKRAGRDCVRMG